MKSWYYLIIDIAANKDRAVQDANWRLAGESISLCMVKYSRECEINRQCRILLNVINKTINGYEVAGENIVSFSYIIILYILQLGWIYGG